MPNNKKLIEKKVVTIRDVISEDWTLLTEIADVLGFNMSQMIHIYADQFRFGSEDGMELIERIRDEKKRKEEDMVGILTFGAFGTSKSQQQYGKNLRRKNRSKRYMKFMKNRKYKAPPPPLSSGTASTVYAIIHGRCEECQSPLLENKNCSNPLCKKYDDQIISIE